MEGASYGHYKYKIYLITSGIEDISLPIQQLRAQFINGEYKCLKYIR